MPRLAIHPGEHLSEQLNELGMSAAAFARIIGVPTNRVTELINGKRSISADTALRLAKAFGTSARFWMNLQVLHDLRVAESSAGTWMTKIRRVVTAATAPPDRRPPVARHAH